MLLVVDKSTFSRLQDPFPFFMLHIELRPVLFREGKDPVWVSGPREGETCSLSEKREGEGERSIILCKTSENANKNPFNVASDCPTRHHLIFPSPQQPLRRLPLRRPWSKLRRWVKIWDLLHRGDPCDTGEDLDYPLKE